jgi:hypothetical protein
LKKKFYFQILETQLIKILIFTFVSTSMELWRSNFENRRRSWVAPSVMGGSGRPPSVVLLDDGGTRTAEAYYCFLLSADVTIPFFFL